jgi:DNA-binding response OmpR family regulator
MIYCFWVVMLMGKPRILMVEDEPAILKANAEHLCLHGYDVTQASCIADAWASFENSVPDLILLDVMLGDGSGFDFCNRVRQQSSAPIVYLTALGSYKDEELGFALGGDDYIVKPYNLNVLTARIAALLRRVGVPSGGRLEIPPLSVDITTAQCKLLERNIELSRMELLLLYFFMENFGRRIEHDVLYEKVWGMPAMPGSHTVKEHVYRLRKKLDLANPNSNFQLIAEGKTYLFGKIRY